ncbi:peptidase M42 family protein [Gottschalkia purinilytica]|uniref:Peptidase M42 family protein n=1 Tax=Gottschalkia purinilytica TaxID=1503 RepID=A0A0L0WBT5_GOTPU|nr:M42 family peptidase [Gottschalkia purinilytica]KNF08951.1 peptidase M42 family protein [Gottschalkia purinilytica]
MLLKELSNLNGVSGNEKSIRDFIINNISNLVDDIKVDKIGNIIAYKEGIVKYPKIMISAHMDEPGLMINKINSDGLLKFTIVGNIDERSLVSKLVEVGSNKINGVIGAKPIHLQKSDERKKNLSVNQLYIDIGVSSKEEAEKIVKIGDYVSIYSEYIELGNDLIKGKAFGSRVGCNLLMDLLKEQNDFSIYYVFTVMKEVGITGSIPVSYSIDPDISIVLDGTNTNTEYINNGPIISFMENRNYFDRNLISLVSKVAKEKNISYQLLGFDANKSDADKLQLSRDGVRTIKISVPCKYMKSPSNIISKTDYSNTKKLIGFVVNELGGLSNENK